MSSTSNGFNSNKTAAPGSIGFEQNSASTTTWWLKVQGSGNTGWIPLPTISGSSSSVAHGDVFGWGYITFSNKTFTSTSTRYPFSYVSYNKMTVATTSVNSIRAQETGLYRCSLTAKVIPSDSALYGMFGINFGNNDLPLGFQVGNIRFWNDPDLSSDYYLTTHIESIASLVAGDSIWDRMETSLFWDPVDGSTSTATLTGDVHVLVQKLL